MQQSTSRYIFIILGIFTFNVYVHSKSNIDAQIYKCFISGDLVKWKMITDSVSKEKLNINQKLELINLYYGYIGYQLKKNNDKEMVDYIEKGENLIDELLIFNPNSADLYAFKCAFTGFKLKKNPKLAIILGNKANELIDIALKINSENIQANIEKAHLLYYTPALFGGDKNLSIEYYHKSIDLFEKNKVQIQKNWLYLNTLVELANLYIEKKEFIEAVAIYDKVLKIEPNFILVKKELYPNIRDSPKFCVNGQLQG